MREFSLSLAAVDVLSQVLGVSCRLFPFEVPSFGQLEEDRNRIAKAVLTDLTNRGLVGGNRIDPDVEAALTVTADHDIGVGMTGVVEGDREVRARAAAAGGTGVVVVQEGQSLRFRLVGPASLARELVALLPPLQAGPGQSVQVTQAAPAPAEEGFVRQVRAPRSAADAQLRMAATMLERPRVGTGFFAVGTRGRADGGTLGWVDTDAGRYLVLKRSDGDGQVRTTFSPADGARLVQQLDEVIAGAVR